MNDDELNKELQPSIDESSTFSESNISYFQQDVDPNDIPSYWVLKKYLPRLTAFVGLFRGSEEDILIRLLFLMEIASNPGKAEWSINSLRHLFTYLSDTAFHTVLNRLKDSGIIHYGRETGNYLMTPLGQKAYGIITSFLKDNDEDSIGLLTGLIYAGEITGTLGGEELSHLLGRLPLSSASEDRILKARNKFQPICHYIDKGSEIIDKITSNPDVDRNTHRIAQQIGQSQAKLAKSTASFQRALNDIEKQKIHLGSWGLSTSDINKYLIGLESNEFLELIRPALGVSIEPVLLLTDILYDIAEYELIDKENPDKQKLTIPKPKESPATVISNQDSFKVLEELTADLRTIEATLPICASIPKRNYEESAYRLSMLSFLGAAAKNSEDIMDEFASLPLQVITGKGVEAVGKYGVKEISKGNIVRNDKGEKSSDE